LKRFFAIVLLSVHLFYLGGYALLFQYYIHKADVRMVKQVYDNKINNAKLIELKIPVHMPTVLNWSEYAVVAGQIQLKNAYYNYVKLKMTRDTMFFVCLPNTTKTRLVNANIIIAKQISDVPLSKKGDQGVKKINTFIQYNFQAFQYRYSEFGTFLKRANIDIAFQLNNPFIDSPVKPPTFIT